MSKRIKKKPFKYQYKVKFISEFNPSEEIDENYYERYNDDSMYDYKNSSELNEILASFTTVTDNLIQIHLDKKIE